jgi:hypothetical protein
MKTRVLFTGYAHVHFVCFRPLFDRLVSRPDVEVYLSGGLRGLRDLNEDPDVEALDTAALYAPFDVSGATVLPVARIAGMAFDYLFAGNTRMIRPRAVDTAVQIFHGLSFRNKAVRSAQLGADYFFLVGPYMKRRFVAAGLLAPDDPRAIEIGFPKTDALVDGRQTAASARARLGLRSDRPVVLYAPTGQRQNSLETMGEEVLARLDAGDRFTIVVKPHDHPKDRSIDWTARLRARRWRNVTVTDELDVVPLLTAADLLVTDASSVASEFALLDRPMIFLDVPELIARARAARESQLDLETWGRRGGGGIWDTPAVVVWPWGALAEPSARSATRRRMAQDLFYNPGRATDAAATWLGARLASGRPRPARAA